MPTTEDTPEVVGVRDIRVSGVTYRVSRRVEQQNRFKVVTVNDRRGSKRGVATAVQQAYGCQRAKVTEILDGWKEADAVGTFCSNRGWQPLR